MGHPRGDFCLTRTGWATRPIRERIQGSFRITSDTATFSRPLQVHRRANPARLREGLAVETAPRPKRSTSSSTFGQSPPQLSLNRRGHLRARHALRGALHYRMIRSFRHKGLKRLHEDDDPRGVMAEQSRSCVTYSPDWMCRNSCGHGYAGIPVASTQGRLGRLLGGDGRANWRVIFRFADGEVLNVDYLDYH